MSEQLYLLKISSMNTCDDCDIVPSAEIIIDHDLSTADMPIIDALHTLIRRFSDTLQSAPLEGIRPMTRDEIKQYRDEEREEDGSLSLLDGDE